MSFALLTVCAGCGGGNGGGGIFVQLPMAKMVPFQAGNDLKFSFAGLLVEAGAGGVVTKGASGSFEVNCTAKAGNQITLVETTKCSVSGASFSSTKTIVFDQPADGSLTEVSESVDGGPVQTITTTFKIPGTWSLTTSVTGSGTLSGGDKVANSLFVQKATNVTVPAGSYFTWESKELATDKSGVLSDFVEDWEPGFSWWVKASGVRALPFGVMSGDFVLTSTNMTLPKA